MQPHRYVAILSNMQLSITHKLVLAFFSLTTILLVATLGLARWSFQQGFLDYVNALEQTRLEIIRDDLAEEYAEAGGSWSSVSPRRFDSLLRIAMGTSTQSTRDRPPRNRPPLGRPQQDAPPHGRPPPPRGPERLGPPTALLDAHGQLVMGVPIAESSTDLIRVPIVVDGTLVGELLSEPRRQISSPQDTAFSKQQLITSWLIGAVALLLAMIVSVVFAKRMLAPVQRMIASVRQLANGDYAVRLNERRGDELGQLTQDLDQLASRLEKNRSSRQRWLADISHELRTPLTVLTGEIEAVRDGVRKLDQQQFDSLAQELGRLRYLIDDLYELSISDVGGLRYKFKTVDIKDALESIVGFLQERASNQGITLDAKNLKSAMVNMDINRIDQLLQNLLENSLAYTDAPGRIEITMTRIDSKIAIHIQDTPPGVSQAECEQIFEPLYRQDKSRSRRTGGAGLGLAICRNIVKAHNGLITASPSELGGLHIRIELPISRETNA